jgi:hypothetical protein
MLLWSLLCGGGGVVVCVGVFAEGLRGVRIQTKQEMLQNVCGTIFVTNNPLKINQEKIKKVVQTNKKDVRRMYADFFYSQVTKKQILSRTKNECFKGLAEIDRLVPH